MSVQIIQLEYKQLDDIGRLLLDDLSAQDYGKAKFQVDVLTETRDTMIQNLLGVESRLAAARTKLSGFKKESPYGMEADKRDTVRAHHDRAAFRQGLCSQINAAILGIRPGDSIWVRDHAREQTWRAASKDEATKAECPCFFRRCKTLVMALNPGNERGTLTFECGPSTSVCSWNSLLSGSAKLDTAIVLPVATANNEGKWLEMYRLFWRLDDHPTTLVFAEDDQEFVKCK